MFKLGASRLLQRFFLILCVVTIIGSACVAQTPSRSASEKSSLLRNFLQSYLRDPQFPDDPTTRFFSAQAHLKNNNEDYVVVYITGESFCGSGGCDMLVLESNNDSFKVVSKTTLVRLPIKMLNTTTNDWHDLSVNISGGGTGKPCDVLLPFNGSEYPGNPTVSPSRPLAWGQSAQILIPIDANGALLYDEDSTKVK